MKVDSHYLPPRRREDITLFTMNGGPPNFVRIVEVLQKFFAHTNLVTQLKVYNESLHFVRGFEGHYALDLWSRC